MTEQKTEYSALSFLVVEPDDGKRTHIVRLLRDMGYEHCDEASDGAMAFHVLKRQPVHCVISAWEMPQMNGLSLLRVVCADEELYTIPFFILTPRVERRMVMEAGKYGVAGILVEPVKHATLEQKVKEVLGAPRDEETIKTEQLFAKARALIQEKKFPLALDICREILDVHESAEVYYNIGYIHSQIGRYDEAIVAYRKAVLINHYHGRAYKMMGNTYLAMDKPDEAEECFEKAGDIFFEREMDAEAEASFREALKINPSMLDVYNTLGIIYRRQHKPKQAIELYRKAIESAPEDARVHYNLGRALLEDKQIAEARKAFEKARAIDPELKDADRMLDAIELGF